MSLAHAGSVRTRARLGVAVQQPRMQAQFVGSHQLLRMAPCGRAQRHRQAVPPQPAGGVVRPGGAALPPGLRDRCRTTCWRSCSGATRTCRPTSWCGPTARSRCRC